LHYSDCRANG